MCRNINSEVFPVNALPEVNPSNKAEKLVCDVLFDAEVRSEKLHAKNKKATANPVGDDPNIDGTREEPPRSQPKKKKANKEQEMSR